MYTLNLFLLLIKAPPLYTTPHLPLKYPNSLSRAHSPIFPSLRLRHSSFSNPSVALPTSQLILQRFRCFTYVTAHSPTLLSLLLCHRLFTYIIWRAAHMFKCLFKKFTKTLIFTNTRRFMTLATTLLCFSRDLHHWSQPVR